MSTGAFARSSFPAERRWMSAMPSYYGLYPLDTPSDRPPREINGQPGPGIGYFGFRSWVYKAGSEKDGKCYVLRRLESASVHL